MEKSFKVQIFPNKEQQKLMFKSFGCARFAYNWALNKQEENYKNGGKFINTSRLKIKESDRIQAVDTEIQKFGAKIADFESFVTIDKQILTNPKNTLNGQNDHRIVMMLAVMASVYGGCIDGIEAVNKSYPNFFSDIKKLGIEVHYVE